MTAPSHRHWIFRPILRAEPRLRLFCFPYAGAGAAVFRSWGRGLPADVEVCGVRPPGRETRLGEPAFQDMEPLVTETLDGIAPLLDRPFAFFGHSMGAVLAFELTHRLRATGARMPTHLILSGRRAPRVPSRYPPIFALPDEEFLEAIDERYGGIPEEIAREPALLRLLLPCLKADVAVIEKHDGSHQTPLEIPLTVLSGVDDATTLPEEARAWAEETTGSFSFSLFPGDHFFIDTAQRQVLPIIARLLGGVTSAARVGG